MDIDPPQLESLVLPLILLERSPDIGLQPERATTLKLRVLQYEYSCWKLAQAWLIGKLCSADVEFPGFDDTPIKLTAYTLTTAYADIEELGAIMCHGRKYEPASDPLDIRWGYSIAPAGLTDTFSEDAASVVAWMLVHKTGPALLIRRGHDVEEHIDKWLENWARSLDLKKPWPKLTEETKSIYVPEEWEKTLQKFRSRAHQQQRKMRQFKARRR